MLRGQGRLARGESILTVPREGTECVGHGGGNAFLPKARMPRSPGGVRSSGMTEGGERDSLGIGKASRQLGRRLL